MPSDAFIGILQGLGSKYQEHNQNLLTMEADRRKQIADMTEKIAMLPDMTPEAANQLLTNAYHIRATPHDKKLAKELENPMEILTKGVAPKMGQSWLGGQTQNQVQAQPMPIAAEIPEPGPTAPMGVLNPATGALVTGTRSGVPTPPTSMRTPEPSTYNAPMPEPTPQYRRPARYTIPEQQQQYRQGLQAKSDIETEADIRKTNAESSARAVPVPKPMQSKLGIGPVEFPEIISASSGIYKEEADVKARAEAATLARSQQLDIAKMNEEGRNERAQQYNQTREMLGQMNRDNRLLLAQFALGNREIPADVKKGIGENADVYKIINGVEGMLEDPTVASELASVAGPVDQWLAKGYGAFDALSQNQQNYMTGLGLLRTITAHPLFGSAFTNTEKAQMQTFIPELSQHPGQALNRVKALKGWIANRVYNYIQRAQVPATRQKAMQQATESGFSPEVLQAYGANSAFNTLSGAEQAVTSQIPSPTPAGNTGTGTGNSTMTINGKKYEVAPDGTVLRAIP